jgi:hypothetical protein
MEKQFVSNKSDESEVKLASWSVDAFEDDIDILRAYLKEHNIPFGFLKNN